jgi:HAD superfamily hydrolase (TIGR01509 family)
MASHRPRWVDGTPFEPQPNRMFEAVIFDVDGTLVDSVDIHARAWQEALADFGYQASFDDVRSQIGKGADQLIPVFVPEPELGRIAERLSEHRSALFKERYLPSVTGFPGVRALFERLRAQGKRIALASSAKGDELAHYQRVAGIEGLADAETSADDADRSKPHPDIFEAALRRLSLAPDACVVVGDTPHDATAAARARLRIVGVLCGGFPEQQLRDKGCHAVYADPRALHEIYERLGDAAFESADGGVRRDLR